MLPHALRCTAWQLAVWHVWLPSTATSDATEPPAAVVWAGIRHNSAHMQPRDVCFRVKQDDDKKPSIALRGVAAGYVACVAARVG
jgi:hypothetical protein